MDTEIIRDETVSFAVHCHPCGVAFNLTWDYHSTDTVSKVRAKVRDDTLKPRFCPNCGKPINVQRGD